MVDDIFDTDMGKICPHLHHRNNGWNANIQAHYT